MVNPSKEGSSTDLEGTFRFQTNKKLNELQFSYLGYETYTYKVSSSVEEGIFIELNPAGIQIEETVVVAKRKKNKIPKDTLAISLQQLVVDNKEANRPKSFESYSYKEHTKIEFDFYKLGEKFTSRKVFKPFRVINEYIDTTDNGVTYLPLLLQERLSKFYYQSSPPQEKELLLGQYMTGINNMSAMVMLDDIFETFDLYENIIIAGGKSFTSPFSNSGLLTYRYYLTDSLSENNKTYYRLDFFTKSQRRNCF